MLEGAGIGAYAYTGYRVTTLGTTKTPADEIIVLHVLGSSESPSPRQSSSVQQRWAPRSTPCATS